MEWMERRQVRWIKRKMPEKECNSLKEELRAVGSTYRTFKLGNRVHGGEGGRTVQNEKCGCYRKRSKETSCLETEEKLLQTSNYGVNLTFVPAHL